MPEGDSLHRVAIQLQVLVGEKLEVETPHPRAAAERIAERLDGRRLEQVDAVGKNVLLRFEGGIVLRSHLRMSGRWRVQARGAPRTGRPWLVLRGGEHEAVLWNGPVLELHARGLARLGPDIVAEQPDFDTMLVNLRALPQTTTLGEGLLDQRVVAGIGNMWKAESLWRAGLSPWLRLDDATDGELLAVLREAALMMRAALGSGREPRQVHGRAGRPCTRCGARIQSRGQGDDNRTAYWCPGCQKGEPRPTP